MRPAGLLLLLAALSASAQPPATPTPPTPEFLQQRIRELEAENRQLQEQSERLRRLAERVPALDARNQSLEQHAVELERALQVARQENAALRDDRSRSWFLLGAGVLLVGLLGGLILPRLRPRTRRWNEL
ncbi:MAG: TIGR04211 family SH3 domain-containing protein [Candidatus Competibacterales bacterium]|nr:TIGR04211 family SH3 domain-containing protein [Candidatus Competibacterales bacterium]